MLRSRKTLKFIYFLVAHDFIQKAALCNFLGVLKNVLMFTKLVVDIYEIPKCGKYGAVLFFSS